MTITDAQLEAQYVKCGMKPKGTTDRRAPSGLGPVSERKQRATELVGTPYKSRTEKQYAEHLRTLLDAKVIEWFAYEPVRLRIARAKRSAFYTPDWLVKLPGGVIEFHETKGHWKTADRLRVRVAAGLFPFRFVGVTREDGQWKYEEFSEEAA